MTRHDTTKRHRPRAAHGRAFEAYLLELVRAAHANFGPWISIVDGDLRIEWFGGSTAPVRGWSPPQLGGVYNDGPALEVRGWVDSWLERNTAVSGNTRRYRLTVEGLLAIGAFPLEYAGFRHGNGEKGRSKEAKGKEQKPALRLVKAAGCGGRYPSF